MITLQPITDPQKLEEYFRFRYRIYAESAQQGFLESDNGTDRDAYDDTAVHLGWYLDGRLVGCVRFVRPIPGEAPLYCYTHLPEGPKQLVGDLMDSYLAQDLPFVEVSRICIEPALRTLAHTRDFVLATMAYSHTLQLDQAVFTCFRPHASFWLRMGFTVLPGAVGWTDPKVLEVSDCMVYRHAYLPPHILNALPPYLEALGHEQAA